MAELKDADEIAERLRPRKTRRLEGRAQPKPAKPRRTQPRNKPNTPNLFSQPDMNFSSGNDRGPSNNIPQQQVFSASDPYASRDTDGSSRVLDAIRQAGTSVSASEPSISSAYNPGLPSPYGGAYQSQVASQMAAPSMPPDPRYAPYGGLNPDRPIRNAAQLFSGSVAGNPFITPEELARMRAGYAPLEQGINPAFYRYTSPVIQQALAGLRQSVGYRPEDAEFITRQFTPAGLR